MSESKNTVEMHGCIVCARLFTIVAMNIPDRRLVDCGAIHPAGHRVIDEGRRGLG
jgi:hypothetical protein